METLTNTKKQFSPTYLSVAKLKEVIELVSTRNLADISSNVFKSYGFNSSDAALAVNALKFLNLIDENGKPSDTMTKLRLKGDLRKEVFEAIVKNAYRKLFDVMDKPYELSSDDLSNEFFVQYSLTPRIVKTAVPAFLKLCEYAGLKEEGSVATRKASPRLEKKDKIIKNHSRNDLTSGVETKSEHEKIEAGFATVSVADGRMKLHLPQKLKDRLLDDDSLNEDWRMLVKAIRFFADKYIPITQEGVDSKA